jgi:hypothetical protein
VKYSKEEKETARERLSFLKPGNVIYTELLSVSRSGMTRHIKPIIIQENEPNWIGYNVAVLLEERLDDNGGVVMGGCGMDMGFHLVYELSSILFRDGFMCLGERCPSNDHSNGDGDRTPHLHKSGGYALKQRWL